MFNFFNRTNPNHQELIWKLKGLHCSSCAMNIDLALEELPGVIKIKTNYPNSQTQITIDPKVARIPDIKTTLKELGYSVVD